MADEILAALRVMLAASLGGLVVKGLLTEDQAGMIIAGILSLVGVIIMAVMAYLRSQLTALLARAAKYSEVKEIVASPEVANAVPSAKVVPSDPSRDL